MAITKAIFALFEKREIFVANETLIRPKVNILTPKSIHFLSNDFSKCLGEKRSGQFCGEITLAYLRNFLFSCQDTKRIWFKLGKMCQEQQNAENYFGSAFQMIDLLKDFQPNWHNLFL